VIPLDPGRSLGDDWSRFRPRRLEAQKRSEMPRTALYAGSFDPVTNGHVDVIRGAAKLCDRLVIAIGTHLGKQPLFTVEARLEMLRAICDSIAKKEKVTIETVTFNDLVVSAAKRAGATILIRGLRDASDFDYEMQMAGMNGSLSAKIQTVFLPATPATRPITATLVRQIAAMGGDVSAFVPAPAAKRLAARFSRKS
jgi:pantetheine-phosphate adenylyltransferase